jgi:hypothetical protein
MSDERLIPPPSGFDESGSACAPELPMARRAEPADPQRRDDRRGLIVWAVACAEGALPVVEEAARGDLDLAAGQCWSVGGWIQNVPHLKQAPRGHVGSGWTVQQAWSSRAHG